MGTFLPDTRRNRRSIYKNREKSTILFDRFLASIL